MDLVAKVFEDAHNQLVKNLNRKRKRKRNDDGGDGEDDDDGDDDGDGEDDGNGDDDDVPVIIHLKYHPRGIQRSDLRRIYNQTLGVKIKNKVIIAVSRPKNLREQLCRSHLPSMPKCDPSDFLPISYQNPAPEKQIE